MLEKCVKIKNNSPQDFKIRYTIQRYSHNRIFKITKSRNICPWLFGGWRTETTDYCGCPIQNGVYSTTEHFSSKSVRKIYLSFWTDTVKVEIMDENGVCFKEIVLEVGEVLTVTEDTKLKHVNSLNQLKGPAVPFLQ